jgi:Tfp pilus assembly protein PilF
VIQEGVAVFNGDYSIPMARAIHYVHAARHLRSSKNLAGALQEAETAVSIDPQYIEAQQVLGQILQDQGRNAEASGHYSQAMAIARKMEPAVQQEQVNWINLRLAELSKSTAQGK